jgi:hypothetical protein
LKGSWYVVLPVLQVPASVGAILILMGAPGFLRFVGVKPRIEERHGWGAGKIRYQWRMLKQNWYPKHSERRRPQRRCRAAKQLAEAKRGASSPVAPWPALNSSRFR